MVHPPPELVVSRCLGFEACRYDGQVIQSHGLQQIVQHAKVRAVCPEMDIGMGVPREPVRLVERDGQLGLLEISTGVDHTQAMQLYCQRVLEELGEVDGFVLKARSPSCGLGDAKVYSELQDVPVLRLRAGMFAGAAQEAYPAAAFIDEEQLSNSSMRHHFLKRVFTTARFRRARKEGSREAIAEFHERHTRLLLALGEEATRQMEQVVAKCDRASVAEVFSQYQPILEAALAQPAPVEFNGVNPAGFEPYPPELTSL